MPIDELKVRLDKFFDQFKELCEKYPNKDIEFSCDSDGSATLSVDVPMEIHTTTNARQEIEVIDCTK